jgi:hypothetical protein
MGEMSEGCRRLRVDFGRRNEEEERSQLDSDLEQKASCETAAGVIG